MRKLIVFCFLSVLLLSCVGIEAKNRHRIKVISKQELIKKQKTFKEELSDSIGDELNDSIAPEQHIGKASWYYYRGGLFAASTKFKKGSVLRVINPANNKYVDVTVNDYGPNKRKHPNRIIDLDKIAFQQIAQLKSGIISIIVCPLKIF